MGTTLFRFLLVSVFVFFAIAEETVVVAAAVPNVAAVAAVETKKETEEAAKGAVNPNEEEVATMTWTQNPVNANLQYLEHYAAVSFKSAMYVLAGAKQDGSGTYIAANDVFRSSDYGKNWNKVPPIVATPPKWFSARQGAAGVVFNNFLWVMGGMGADKITGAPSNNLATIWYTSDLTQGFSPANNAPFEARHDHCAVSTGTGSSAVLYMIGGNTGSLYTTGALQTGVPIENGEVWRATADLSTSGVLNWEHPSDLSIARFAHGCVSFKNKVWVIGGLTDRGASILNDVWSTANGVEWASGSVGTGAGTSRYHFLAAVFFSRIWIIGGFSDILEYSENSIFSTSDGITWTKDAKAAPEYVSGGVPVDVKYMVVVQRSGASWKLAASTTCGDFITANKQCAPNVPVDDSTTPCAGATCTTAECCGPAVYCDSFDEANCDSGLILRLDAATVKCGTTMCHSIECCVSSCAQYDRCGTAAGCTADSGCGWCYSGISGTLGSCIAIDAPCSGDFATQASQCRDSCSSLTTCGSCTNDATSGGSCGWCSSSSTCMVGDTNGPSDSAACPATSAWVYNSQECPLVYCTTFPCNNYPGWVWKYGHLICNNEVCDKATCCARQPYCRSLVVNGGKAGNCPTGFKMVNKNKKCAVAPCTKEECCVGYCSTSWTGTCTGDLVPITKLKACAAYGCTEKDCCTPRPTCKSFKTCPSGTSKLVDPTATLCQTATCTKQDCCRQTCKTFKGSCYTGTAMTKNLKTKCAGWTCTVDDCCVAAGKCSDGYTDLSCTSLNRVMVTSNICVPPPCTRKMCCVQTCKAFPISQCQAWKAGTVPTTDTTKKCAGYDCKASECCIVGQTCGAFFTKTGGSCNANYISKPNSFICPGSACAVSDCCYQTCAKFAATCPPGSANPMTTTPCSHPDAPIASRSTCTTDDCCIYE